MSPLVVKRFKAPTLDGGEKSIRVFVPGVIASLAVGIAGFVWLLACREWSAALCGLVAGLVANLGIMGLATRTNLRLFEKIDRAVDNRDGRRLTRFVWSESLFLHAAKSLAILVAFAAPILLLRDGAAHLLPAELFGLGLADPPQGFLYDESGDNQWHATFLPFCQLAPVAIAIATVAWRPALGTLAGAFAAVAFVSSVVMALFNLRRYRAKMAARDDKSK